MVIGGSGLLSACALQAGPFRPASHAGAPNERFKSKIKSLSHHLVFVRLC